MNKTKNYIGDNTYWYDPDPKTTITVLETESKAVDTGLLTKDGKKIYKQIKLEKIGYV